MMGFWGPWGCSGDGFVILWRSFCRLQAKIVKTLFFADSSMLFDVFSWFWGPRILPKSSKIAPRSFLGTELAAKVCPK